MQQDLSYILYYAIPIKNYIHSFHITTIHLKTTSHIIEKRNEIYSKYFFVYN